MKASPLLTMVLVANLGCREDAPAKPSATNDAPAATTATQTAEQPADSPVKWSIEIDGRPRLQGTEIVRRQSNEGESISFFGQPVAIRLDTGADGELLRFNLRDTEPQTECRYDGASNEPLKFEIRDDRGMFVGNVLCGPIGAPEDQMQRTGVKGWFEAKLARRPPPMKARMTGAGGKEIEPLPPDNEPK